MKIPSSMPGLKRYRYPGEVIAFAVWAYYLLALSTADVEYLLAERAVDSNGDVLEILVQNRRNAKAAKRFLARLFARFSQPRVVITDKLPKFFKPIKTLPPNADHRAHKGLNNRIEGSHRPTRRREKIMGRFKSHRQAQRFLASHDQISTLCKPRRYRMSANHFRHARSDALSLWTGYALEMTA